MRTQNTTTRANSAYTSANIAEKNSTAIFAEPVVPMGWHTGSLPDGLVSVKRAWWRRWGGAALVSSLAGIATVIFAAYFTSIGSEPMPRDASLAFAAIIASCFLWLPASFLFKEDIHVGRNFLEYRRDFWLYRYRRQIDSGAFRVSTEYAITQHRSTIMVGKVPMPGPIYYRHTWTRKLSAEDAEQSVVLFQSCDSMTTNDADRRNRDYTRDEVMQLATYLADMSGWHLAEEPVRYVS